MNKLVYQRSNKNSKVFSSLFKKGIKTSFPTLQDLELVKGRMRLVSNKKGEFLRKVHYRCFLLCSEAGLRISEAVKFDLKAKTRKGLYQITKPKKQKSRLVYVPKKVVRELKKQNWKPNQTNRWNFYHFLKKIKQRLETTNKIELTPHTLLRAFTTYHAENGIPLPLLQKLLGHSSIRTTALYWRDIYGENEVEDILKGKMWLEPKTKPPQPGNSVPPPSENLENIREKTVVKPSPPPLKIEPKPVITSYQSKPVSEISAKPPTKFLTSTINLNEKQSLTEALSKAENEIKNLKDRLKAVQVENEKLKIQLAKTEKEKKQEKERADYYEQQLKTIVKGFCRWMKSAKAKKINYYQQLEQEKINKEFIQQNKLHDQTELEAKIEQKPPWKN